MSAKHFPPGARIFRHAIYFPNAEGKLTLFKKEYGHALSIEDFRDGLTDPPTAEVALIVSVDVTRFVSDPKFINAFNA